MNIGSTCGGVPLNGKPSPCPGSSSRRLPVRLKAGYDGPSMVYSQCSKRRTERRMWSGLVMWIIIAVFALMPLIVRADDEGTPPDVRLQGYPINVVNQGGSGVTYLFFVVLTLITAGVLFMNAKRSHLD